MRNRKIQVKNERLLFVILILTLFFVTLLLYNFVFATLFDRGTFANEMIEISDENEESIFNIQRILLYSSANAIDNSEDQSLEDMSLCRFNK